MQRGQIKMRIKGQLNNLKYEGEIRGYRSLAKSEMLPFDFLIFSKEGIVELMTIATSEEEKQELKELINKKHKNINVPVVLVSVRIIDGKVIIYGVEQYGYHI